MELKDYLLILRRHLLLFIVATAGIVAGDRYLVRKEAVLFEATARIVLQATSPQEMLLERLTTGPTSKHLTFQTRVALLQSEKVADIALRILRAEVPSDPAVDRIADVAVAGAVRRLYGADPNFPSDDLIAARRSRYANLTNLQILGSLRVEQTPATQIISISATSTSPEVAVDLPNAMGLALQVRVHEIIVGEVVNARELAETRLQSALRDTEDAKERMLRVREDLGLGGTSIGVEEQIRVLLGAHQEMLRRRDDLSEQIAQIQDQIRVMETATPTVPEIDPVPTARYGQLSDQLQRDEMRVAELSLRYTDEHIEIQAIRNEIADIRRRMTIEEETSVEVAKKKLEEARKAVDLEHQANIEQFRRQVTTAEATRDRLSRELPTRESEITAIRSRVGAYLEVERDLRRRETEAARMGQLVEEFRLRTQLLPSYVDMDRPASEAHALGRKGEDRLGFVILMAIIFATGLCYVVDYFDTSVRNQTDVKRYLNLPVLATIPRIREQAKLLTQIAMKSPLAEIFGRLATVIAKILDRHAATTLLIVSVTKREGKSTIAANLAIALARAGRTVVLLDCDLRRPALHRMFNLANSEGLSTYLSGKSEARETLSRFSTVDPEPEEEIEPTEDETLPEEIDPMEESTEESGDDALEEMAPVEDEDGPEELTPQAEEYRAEPMDPGLSPGDLRRKMESPDDDEPAVAEPDVTDLLSPTGIDGLYVIPSGPTPSNPLGLVESARLEGLLGALRRRFDYVIIDSPPIDSTADPLALAGRSQAVLLVTLSGEVKRYEVTWAKRMLHEVDANLLGVVLNQSTTEVKAYYYYYGDERRFRSRE